MNDEINLSSDFVARINKGVPIWQKKCLTIEEAASYSGIGRNKLRELVMKKKCPFVLAVGNKICIIREKLDEYTDERFRL